jgi:maltose-binding protein MalE
LSKRLIMMLAGVMAMAVVAAGCGSSSSSSDSSSTSGSDTTASTGDTTATTAALSKAELIKQGDAICTKGNKSIETEANEFAKENNVNTKKPTKAQKEEVITEVVAPDVRKQGEEIAELGAPSGDEAEVEAIVAAVEGAADELEENPTLLFEGTNPLSKASKLAASYGFKVCGEE